MERVPGNYVSTSRLPRLRTVPIQTVIFVSPHHIHQFFVSFMPLSLFLPLFLWFRSTRQATSHEVAFLRMFLSSTFQPDYWRNAETSYRNNDLFPFWMNLFFGRFTLERTEFRGVKLQRNAQATVVRSETIIRTTTINDQCIRIVIDRNLPVIRRCLLSCLAHKRGWVAEFGCLFPHSICFRNISRGNRQSFFVAGPATDKHKS